MKNRNAPMGDEEINLVTLAQEYADEDRAIALLEYVVCHSRKEYARKNLDGSVAGINNAESFFSLIRRGTIGSFHHVSHEHLHRYATEFEFRWNHRRLKDGERMEVAIGQAEGKRLTYKKCV